MRDSLGTARPILTLTTRATSGPMPTVRVPIAVADVRLQRELRDLAAHMAGRLDRDELPRDDELLVEEAVDAAVLAALPLVLEIIDRELTPRLEALPLGTRLVLARARSRYDFGVD